MRKPEKVDKSTVLGIAAAVLIAGVMIGVFLLLLPKGAPTQIPAPDNTPAVRILERLPEEGNVQKATISAKGLYYTPYPVKLVVGVPAEITLDTSISSCLYAMVAPSLGIRLYAQEGRNKAYFIPLKAGKYPFTCSMNMGKGMFEFVEASQ